MLDVIIVGSMGKAGLLHYNSYKKIKKNINIYFVDKRMSNNTYGSVKEVIDNNNLDVKKVILDICTPKEEYHKIIENSYNLGIRNFIVEKPFVVKKDFFNKYKNINVVMVENYLFSKITKKILKYINGNKVDKIYGNFSKNRMKDSLNRRGMSKNITTNFEIEMPHLIYIMSSLTKAGNITNPDVTMKDMVYHNITLKNHGYGRISYLCNNIDVNIESNLMNNKTIKKIVVDLEDGRKIIANYAIYDKNLVMIKKADFSVYKDNIRIYHRIYQEDDNFYEFIKYKYFKFLNNKVGKKEKKAIIDFSNRFRLFNNLIDVKRV